MCTGIHTNYIGNSRNNPVLNKNRYLKYINTFSKRDDEIRCHKYAKNQKVKSPKFYKLSQEGHMNFHRHTFIKQ
jgi:hypothetical protein